MRRLALPLLLGLALVGAAPAAAHTGAGARLARCHHAVAPIDRSFHLRSVMRALPGTHVMAMRFRLQVRRGRFGRWRPYAKAFDQPAEGFGRWYRDDPGSERYRYLRTVNGLEGPAARGRHISISYRVRVTFRWFGPGRHVQRTRHVTTDSCFEPELRPDLAVTSVVPGTNLLGVAGYRVTVHNGGRTAAGPFELELGAEVEHVPGVRARRDVHRFFPSTGPCPATGLMAIVDPAAAVDEADETDNSSTIPCS